MNITNYKTVLCKYFRNLLRAVDPITGESNGYTSYVHHTSDYSDLTNLTLKDSSEWIDRRKYIIYGVFRKKKEVIGPAVTINYIGHDALVVSGQGLTTFELRGASIQILVDTTQCKGEELMELDRITSQVEETLSKNSLNLYVDKSFYRIDLGGTNIVRNDNFTGEVIVNFDITLENG